MLKIIKKALKKQKVLLGLLLSLGLGSFAILKGPQIHSSYIRYKVGTEVVSIFGKKSGGTGFHIKGTSGETYILTNNHICNLADENERLTVYDSTGKKMYRNVIVRHETHDLCLVEPIPGYSGLNIASGVDIGEIVGLVGHPGLRPLSISRGEIVGAKTIKLIIGMNLPNDRCFGVQHKIEDVVKNQMMLIILSARGVKNICVATLRSTMFNGISYGGNSGSPVVNFYGNVVGVLFAGSRQVTDAYLVPRDVVKKFVEKY